MGDDNSSGPEWEPWKFDMTDEDFCQLEAEFNTIPSAIQSSGAYQQDFEKIARSSTNKTDLRKSLEDHRKSQLHYYKLGLQRTAEDVVTASSDMPKEVWHGILNLITSATSSSSEISGWISPASLQTLLEVVEKFVRRVAPSAPLAIMPILSPPVSPVSATPPPRSDCIQNKSSELPRLRPRKQQQTPRAIVHGGVSKRGSKRRKVGLRSESLSQGYKNSG